MRAESGDEAAARAMMWEPVGTAFAFTGEAFPSIDFQRPDRVRRMIGPYTVSGRFFDRKYAEVEAPEEYGRYGAVVTVKAESGATFTRYRTLYRYAGRIPFWDRSYFATIDLPDELLIDPAAADANRETLSEFLEIQFARSLYRDQTVGAMLAGMAETVPGGGVPGRFEDVWARDRAWWVGLKRKLEGQPPVEPLQTPRAVLRGRAKALTFGTPAEAGMLPGTVDSIEAACSAWVVDADEPLAVCVARRGVVFFYKAYGTVGPAQHGDMRGGARPMTLTTKAPMASITKLMSGTLMMQLVDLGVVKLDEPLSTYLPAFRGVKTDARLTVRHLYTHTSGLFKPEDGLSLDGLHDLERMVAEYAPHLSVGTHFEYTNLGYALGGKIIEAVSGESLPTFYATHLLGPLEMTDTEVTGAAGDAWSTPLDIARLAQMLLNRGAYGEWRFIEPDTFEEMLPVDLRTRYGIDTDEARGIGTQRTAWTSEGLSEATYGHNAGSSAVLRIDPVNELVVVVTRFRPGERSTTLRHRAHVIRTIADGIAKEQNRR